MDKEKIPVIVGLCVVVALFGITMNYNPTNETPIVMGSENPNYNLENHRFVVRFEDHDNDLITETVVTDNGQEGFQEDIQETIETGTKVNKIIVRSRHYEKDVDHFEENARHNLFELKKGGEEIFSEDNIEYGDEPINDYDWRNWTTGFPMYSQWSVRAGDLDLTIDEQLEINVIYQEFKEIDP